MCLVYCLSEVYHGEDDLTGPRKDFVIISGKCSMLHFPEIDVPYGSDSQKAGG